MKQLKTENGLLVRIAFTCSNGIAGYVQTPQGKLIDCRWNLNGQCLVEDELGSFFNLDKGILNEMRTNKNFSNLCDV